jgi:hypothetical protein
MLTDLSQHGSQLSVEDGVLLSPVAAIRELSQ